MDVREIDVARLALADGEVLLVMPPNGDTWGTEQCERVRLVFEEALAVAGRRVGGRIIIADHAPSISVVKAEAV